MSRQRQRSPSPRPSRSKRFRADRDDENDTTTESSVGSQLEVSQTSGNCSTSIERQIRYDLEHNIRSGRVIKIIVKNFMCHRHFVVEFNKRTNLIIGSNGSGKSAILAALTIGLGYNATTTSRCTRVTDYIKHGESQMFTQIWLENGSFDGYDKERFGNVIIVERTVQASGSSVYKLKNERGHVVSTSRAELQRILQLLNIQVDNPVCVLNQELAREFLRTTCDTAQYKCFLKATQIEEIMRMMDECTAIAESSRQSLELRKKTLVHRKRDVDDLTEKYNTMLEAVKMKESMGTYKAQLAWRFVTDLESVCQKLTEELKQLEDAIEEKKNGDKDSESSDKDFQRKIQALQQDYDRKKNECGKLSATCSETRSDIQELVRKQGACRNAINRKQASIARLEENLQTLEAGIEQRRSGKADRVADEKRKNSEKVEKLQETKCELQAKVENSTSVIHEKQRTLEELEENNQSISDNINATKMKRNRCQQDLLRFNNCSQDKLSLYGTKVPALNAKIRQLHQQGKFDELPRGPLGQYIKLRDNRWSSVVETVIGTMLQAYCTSTHADRRRLSQLIRSEFPEFANNSILTTRFIHQPHDISKGCVAEAKGTHLLMNLIKVDDPVVLNCLIDYVRPETILITENSEVAMANTSVKANVPRNLNRVVVTNPPAEFYPQPNYRSYDLQLKQARYLQEDMEKLKQETAENIKQLDGEIEQLNLQFVKEKKACAQLQQILKDHNRQLVQEQCELAQCTQRISSLNSIVYPEEHEEASLQKEIDKIRSDLSDLDKEKKMDQDQQKQLSETVDSKKEDLKKSREMTTVLENKLHELQLKINEINSEHYQHQTNSITRKEELQRMLKNKDDFQPKLTAIKQEIQMAEEAAKAIGNRVDSEQTVEQLKKIIMVTEARLKHIRFSNENLENIKSLLDSKHCTLTKEKEWTFRFDKILKTLESSRVQQFAYLNKLTNQMIMRMKHKFKMVMEIRNYDANIQVDRRNAKLTLSVVPRDHKVQNAVSSTKSLSGGERSFSTVAFLIALWSCVDTPFYFLDEYDVFTDNVTRKTLTVLLLNEAKKKPDRQFCFLTPQDTSSVVSDECTSIHRMPEPERCPR